MEKKEQSSLKLIIQVAGSFVDGMRRAMRVSSLNTEGEIVPLTQQKLAERAGVGRTTIAAYLCTEDGESESVNPDLKIICKLADALNVPPAFLLMRPEDWSRIAEAVMFFSVAVQDEKFRAISVELSKPKTITAVDSAITGLKLARQLDVFADVPGVLACGAKFAKDIEERNAQIKSGIMATAALPPLGKLKVESYALLLSLCAMVGAVGASNKLESEK